MRQNGRSHSSSLCAGRHAEVMGVTCTADIGLMSIEYTCFDGQETGLKKEQTFDEIGILLPIREFEKKMLHHLSEIDGLVLACREKMMKKAGMESLEL